MGELLLEPPRNGVSPATGGTTTARVLTLSAVTGKSFDATSCREAQFARPATQTTTVDSRDLLVCRGNGNLKLVGKAKFPDSDLPDTVFPDTMIALRFDPQRVDTGFVEHQWNSVSVRRQIESAARTTNGAYKINQEKLVAVQLRLPPLDEQRRIAAILDRADRSTTGASEFVAELRGLRAATFQQAFGDPIANPRNWQRVRLGDLVDFVGGGTPSRSRPEYFAGTTCWATAKDIRGETLADTEEHITQDAVDNSATKLVPAGAVLVVVKSKVLMHRLPVAIASVSTCFGQDLKALLPKPGVSARFLLRHLRVGQQALLDRARGANTEGLTLDHLRDYRVLQPPPEIVTSWIEKDTRIERLEAAAVTRAANAGTLVAALSDAMFRGRG